MANPSGTAVSLIGRVLIALIFVISGFFKIVGYSQTVAFATSKGLPLASVAIAGAIVIEVLGGLAVLVGFKTRIAAWILFLYMIPTTLVFHNFWAMTGIQQQDNMAHFMKNVAIMGALLLLAAGASTAYSIDARQTARA